MRSLLCLVALLVAVPAEATITYFASASTPADNGTNATEPITITPPASMVAGDLVLVTVTKRAGSATLSNSTTGGQTWTDAGSGTANTTTTGVFWAVYNGTWDADPAFDATLGESTFSLIMHVFRPTAGTYTWAADTALACVALSGTTTVTVAGVTRNGASAVTLAIWTAQGATAPTWTNLSGSGWVESGGAQYRNTSGSDLSATFAHSIGTGATGDVSKDQSGTLTGVKCSLSFYETAPGRRRILGGGLL